MVVYGSHLLCLACYRDETDLLCLACCQDETDRLAVLACYQDEVGLLADLAFWGLGVLQEAF